MVIENTTPASVIIELAMAAVLEVFRKEFRATEAVASQLTLMSIPAITITTTTRIDRIETYSKTAVMLPNSRTQDRGLHASY